MNNDGNGCFWIVAGGVFAVMCLVGYALQIALLAGAK